MWGTETERKFQEGRSMINAAEKSEQDKERRDSAGSPVIESLYFLPGMQVSIPGGELEILHAMAPSKKNKDKKRKLTTGFKARSIQKEKR